MHAKDIEAQILAYTIPELSCDLIQAKAIRNIEITPPASSRGLSAGSSDGQEPREIVKISITLGYPLGASLASWKENLIEHLSKSFPDTHFELDIKWQIDTHAALNHVKALPNVKNIIAVASGKGGVGKSTIAANLAIALAQEGGRVGILDADIYGPSQPTMLGIHTRPVVKDKKISPIEVHGIQAMSIGLLVDENAAMVWRGPMISMAVQQLLHDTQWDNVDYLIVDLPPGTGDIQLTLSQKIPVSAVVMVTTPQALALKDVRRACAMFQKLEIPVLGIVENMSGEIFGEGGAEKLAEECKIPVLGRFPLDKTIRENTDGNLDAKSPYAESFRNLAKKVSAQLSLQPKTYSQKFPPIKIAG